MLEDQSVRLFYLILHLSFQLNNRKKNVINFGCNYYLFRDDPAPRVLRSFRYQVKKSEDSQLLRYKYTKRFHYKLLITCLFRELPASLFGTSFPRVFPELVERVICK